MNLVLADDVDPLLRLEFLEGVHERTVAFADRNDVVRLVRRRKPDSASLKGILSL